MPATLDDVLAAVRALTAKVDALAEKQAAPTLRGVTLLARHLGAVQPAGASSGGAVPQIAPDALLDAGDGDPIVRFDVKKGWMSEGRDSLKGRALSTCPPRFLDLYAAAMERIAGDPDKAKYRDENLRTAALARGWAARLRKTPARCDGQHGGAACSDPGCYTLPPPVTGGDFA